MSINPKTLPEGTVVEVSKADSFGHRLGWIGNPGKPFSAPPGDGGERLDSPIVRVFVPVPDGMSPTDAERILAEHVEWVPIPAVEKEHIGARLRCEVEGTVTTGKSHSADTDGIYTEDGGAIGYGSTLESWFIHPDDVPQDPDAELIEAMAKAAHGTRDRVKWEFLSSEIKGRRRADARAALAVVREHEAGQR